MSELSSPPPTFRSSYFREDFSRVTVFSDRFQYDAGSLPIISPSESDRAQRASVTLIASARNERHNAARWVECILSATRLPDEIIVVDSASQDGTGDLLAELAAASPVPFTVLRRESGNIAQCRNDAIRQARSPVIAVTDFGAFPHPDWLEKLVAPFEIHPHLEVSAGIYQAITPQGQPLYRRRWQHIDRIAAQDYLPASISIAFTKASWQTVGGYPEWLTITGEDTYFAMELKRLTRQWAFVPEAVVDWLAPESWQAYWQKQRYWSIGDGEVGMNTRYYWLLAKRYAGSGLVLLTSAWVVLMAFLSSVWLMLIAVVGLLVCLAFLALLAVRQKGISLADLIGETGGQLAQLGGFLQGVRNRPQVDSRRWAGLQGVLFVLAAVPLSDTGGGSRSAQLAREAVNRQQLVIYLNLYPSYESVNLKLQICHPNLIAQRFSSFELDRFVAESHLALAAKKVAVLVELPDPRFLPLVMRLKSQAAVIAYDLLDDWNTSLGGDWYSVETEKEIITAANVLFATAPTLQAHLELLSGRPAALLPNAVNLRLFDAHRNYARPSDLPPVGRPLVLYAGALWGDWFDWELLVTIARMCPEIDFVLIGDYRNTCPEHLANVHFLGLKPQTVLPAYLAHSQAAFIPWKVNAATMSTSPLKIYEYLAMYKPVIAPDLPHLRDIPYTLLASNRESFVENIHTALRIKIEESIVDPYIQDNSWPRRVDQLLAMLTWG